VGYKGVTSIINQIEDYREILSNNIAYELEDEEYNGHSKRGLRGYSQEIEN